MGEWIQSPWTDYLDLARCTKMIADGDLASGVMVLGGSLLALLKRIYLRFRDVNKKENRSFLGAECQQGLTTR